MTEDQLSDQLRERLRRVDDLTPPAAPDFAVRAMGASQRRAERRRSWGKGLLGVAAAIAIGTLAVTNLPRTSTSDSSAASGAAAAGASAGTAAPEAAGTNGGLGVAGDPGSAPSGPTPTETSRLSSAAACATTLSGVQTALPTLRQQGLPVLSAACDPRGVVVLRVGTALTPEQRAVLTARYGARVSVADRDGRPLP